jgi:succinate dehydrogenase / fumarate reductase cytochrome b subunit
MTEPEFGASGIEKRRPLSPHLQIYRPMLTMTMSIAHRITGAALYFGTLLLAWFLIAVSTGGGAFSAAYVTPFGTRVMVWSIRSANGWHEPLYSAPSS